MLHVEQHDGIWVVLAKDISKRHMEKSSTLICRSSVKLSINAVVSHFLSVFISSMRTEHYV